MKLARPDMIVLHPLPRVDEIEIAVDDDPRARYFAQAKYGVYARMALIMNMLSDPDPKPLNELADPAAHCTNARCITQVEPYLPHLAQQNNRCGFCDHDLVKNQ